MGRQQVQGSQGQGSAKADAAAPETESHSGSPAAATSVVTRGSAIVRTVVGTTIRRVGMTVAHAPRPTVGVVRGHPGIPHASIRIANGSVIGVDVGIATVAVTDHLGAMTCLRLGGSKREERRSGSCDSEKFFNRSGWF